ncbi:hypothetical protein AB4068_05630 [Arthrobacter sp. 2RAF22]
MGTVLRPLHGLVIVKPLEVGAAVSGYGRGRLFPAGQLGQGEVRLVG